MRVAIRIKPGVGASWKTQVAMATQTTTLPQVPIMSLNFCSAARVWSRKATSAKKTTVA